MLIKQIDGFNLESLERAFNCLFDVLRTTVKTGSFPVLMSKPNLVAIDHFVSVGS